MTESTTAPETPEQQELPLVSGEEAAPAGAETQAPEVAHSGDFGGAAEYAEGTEPAPAGEAALEAAGEAALEAAGEAALEAAADVVASGPAPGDDTDYQRQPGDPEEEEAAPERVGFRRLADPYEVPPGGADHVQEPPYADFVAEALESCADFGRAFGGTDVGRCHKIEARALKVLLPALQQRLQRI